MLFTNIQIAKIEVDYCNRGYSNRPFGSKATGWVGDDSDYPTRYWRVGGNTVITDGGGSDAPFQVYRWHDFIRSTAHLRYPAVQRKMGRSPFL